MGLPEKLQVAAEFVDLFLILILVSESLAP
jgi:hypothetical protein